MTGVAVNEQQADGNAMPFMAIGAGAIIFLPVVYGIAGFIGGMIAGAIYNLVAGIVGGLELEFEQPATTFPAP